MIHSQPTRDRSYSPEQRRRISWRVMLSVLSALVIAASLNFYASKYPRRWDGSGSNRYALTPLTLQVLASLTNTVKVSALFDPDSGIAGHTETLLREYARRSPHIQFTFVNYYLQPQLATLLKANYQIGADAPNVVIFDSGGRFKVVYDHELSDFQPVGQFLETREVRRSAFKGEAAFTSALAAVMDPLRGRLCFLQGHGEHKTESDEPIFGYSKFARLVAEKNLSLESISLAGNKDELPSDCQLLVIAGPQSTIESGEANKILRYLEQGGRILLLTHPYTLARSTSLGLEDLLEKWSVSVTKLAAADDVYTRRGGDVIAQGFTAHPVVNALSRSSGSVYFPLPRVVSKLPSNLVAADAPTAENLILTSTNGLTKSQFRDGVAYPVPDRDYRGEVPLAVAVEKGGVAGVTANRGGGRLIVIGDSSIWGNETLDKYSNRDFATLTLAWLLDRPKFLAIGPRPITEYRLHLNASQLRLLKLSFLLAMPGIVLFFGGLVWIRRRT